MQDLKRLNFLIDKASEIYGSDNQLALALDVHRQQVSDWRAGRKAPGTNLQARMAEIAGLDPAVHVLAAAVEKTGHQGAMDLLAPFKSAWLFTSLMTRGLIKKRAKHRHTLKLF